MEERHLFYDRLVGPFAALPWVGSATVADSRPLSPHGSVTIRLDPVRSLRAD